MESSTLDRSVLDSLRQLTPPGEPDVLNEVLTMFLAEFPRRMDKLRNGFSSGDIQEVQRSAHSLKGSAGNIGAHGLSAICRQLDELSKAGERDRLAPLIDALGLEFGKVESEIHRLMQAS
jgi:HPt (histidine-containing phosphotransfer) domain-containing protein